MPADPTPSDTAEPTPIDPDEPSPERTPARAERHAGTRPVLRALRRSDGRATVGDVAAATGLARHQAEAALRELLESRRGHLEVGAEGTLVYRFEPRFIRRDHEPLWSRVRRAAWKAFQTGFKVWILLMLVVYFVVFVALLLAAVFAGQRDDGGGGGGGRRRHGAFPIPSFWFWYLFWTPNWGWGRPYYGRRHYGGGHRGGRRRGTFMGRGAGHRSGRGRDEPPRVPFYKKVFAFVFGPDRPRPSQGRRDRTVLRLIRARRGVLTAAELVEHTGMPLHEAEEEMARLMVAHEGEAEVSEEGEVAYTFPGLMVSAEGRVSEREPAPAWRRLEPRVDLTGNGAGTDLLIGGINAFNMVAAATAPLFIFPRLGLSGTAAWIGLVWVPLVFGVIFFAVPLARWFGVARENARRVARNVRRVLVGLTFGRSLEKDGPSPVGVPSAVTHVEKALAPDAGAGGDGKLSPGRPDLRTVENGLLQLTAEFDGEVSVGADGASEYRFPAIPRIYRAAEEVRDRLALESRTVGEIVYSSADEPEEAGRRDLAAFDRELEASGEPSVEGIAPRNVAGYIQAPNRVAYLDEIELAAMEEERARERAAAGVR